MKGDAFSGYHTAVNFIFFIGVLGFGVMILHPAFLLVGMAGAFSYYLLLYGYGGLKRIVMMLPMLAAVILLNPLINRSGNAVLFWIFDIPYTLEALIYGGVLSGMFLTMLLWFGCYSAVMTGDKFIGLFGDGFPSLSLLLVMIFRMVPNLIRKGKQIVAARRSIGKYISKGRSGVAEGMSILGCLTTWALEGSVVTADSMRGRGYGSTRRTCFRIFRMTGRDLGLLIGILLIAAGVLTFMCLGHTSAAFTPEWNIAPVKPFSLLMYFIFTMIPTLLHLQEALLWHILRSRI